MKNDIRVRVNGQYLAKDTFTFSGGEVHVRFLNYLCYGKSSATIEAYIYNSDGIMELLMVNDALSRFMDLKHKALILPYLPYARQDRVCHHGEALSVKVMADLINSMNFDKVTTWNCHSEVGVALINNCVNIDIYNLLSTSLHSYIKQTNVVLISPDAGANKKILELAIKCGGAEVIRADKTRCTKTGTITGTEVYCDSLEGKHALIVDDICDKGGTFIALAKKLKEKGAASVNLYVTHSILPDGLDKIMEYIDNIYTNNTWVDTDKLCSDYQARFKKL